MSTTAKRSTEPGLVISQDFVFVILNINAIGMKPVFTYLTFNPLLINVYTRVTNFTFFSLHLGGRYTAYPSCSVKGHVPRVSWVVSGDVNAYRFAVVRCSPIKSTVRFRQN